MQARDLGRVDHVIQPFADQAASAAQPSQLAICSIKGITQYKQHADHETSRQGRRAERNYGDAGTGERGTNVGDLVWRQPGLEGGSCQDTAEGPVDVERIRRRALGALLSVSQTAERTAEAFHALARHHFGHDDTPIASPGFPPDGDEPLHSFAPSEH